MEKTITFDNYEFNYYWVGNSKSPTILFLHGFMGDCHEFDQVISLLNDQFSCLIIDLPGHGKTKVTGNNQCYSMPNTAEAIIKLLDQLNIQKCFLVGYSMGGRLALYLTLKFPERFLKVILESASPSLKTKDECLQRTQLDHNLADELENGDFYDFLIRWYNNPLFNYLKQKPEFEKLLQERLKNNPFELAKSLRNLSTGLQPILWNELSFNKIPILLLAGEQDKKFKKINAEMLAYNPFASLKIISNSGHNIHRENIIIFVEEIRLFLF